MEDEEEEEMEEEDGFLLVIGIEFLGGEGFMILIFIK